MFPLDFTTEQDFDALRRLLTDAQYTTARICERMDLPTIYNFKSLVEGRTERVDVKDRLDLLIRLFMDAEPVPLDWLDEHLNDFERQTLLRLGLVDDHDDGRCRAVALIYPTEGLWIASDLDHNPLDDDPAGKLQDDVVYPAITRNTQHFMSSLSHEPCERFLELCSGTGIAALVASRYAAHTWAVDITRRSSQCARFNARLNRVNNVTVLEGDLYEPVGDAQFDRIVAHPPYIPAEKLEYIYRDGGQDGEQITRRIVADLHKHLLPGGRFQCTCMVTDRDKKPFQDRVRDMLGPHRDEFDVLVVEMGTMHPTEHYAREAIRGRMNFDTVERRHNLFAELEVVDLLYCSFVLQRAESARKVFTARTQRGPRTTGKDFDWLLRWETAQVAPPGPPPLMDTKLTASPRIRLMVVHDMKDFNWTPAEFRIGSESPFVSKAQCPAWGAALIAQCDGVGTVRQHFHALQASGVLPQDAPEEEFLELVRSLIAAGFVQTDAFPLPFQQANGQRLSVEELFRDDHPGASSG